MIMWDKFIKDVPAANYSVNSQSLKYWQSQYNIGGPVTTSTMDFSILPKNDLIVRRLMLRAYVAEAANNRRVFLDCVGSITSSPSGPVISRPNDVVFVNGTEETNRFFFHFTPEIQFIDMFARLVAGVSYRFAFNSLYNVLAGDVFSITLTLGYEGD